MFESWTIKKIESWRVDAFELWCWRRLLRVPWTTRRSNQSVLKEISPECSLEGLMLKMKLQYFGHLMWRTDSLEKTLMLGKIESGRRRGWQRMRWLDGITVQWTWVWVGSGSWWWAGKPGLLQSMGSQRVRHDWVTELNWTELMSLFLFHRWVHFCHNLDSTCKWYHMLFVFLFLTYFTQYDNLSVHSCCCKWHYFVLFFSIAEWNSIVYRFGESLNYHPLWNSIT